MYCPVQHDFFNNSFLIFNYISHLHNCTYILYLLFCFHSNMYNIFFVRYREIYLYYTIYREIPSSLREIPLDTSLTTRDTMRYRPYYMRYCEIPRDTALLHDHNSEYEISHRYDRYKFLFFWRENEKISFFSYPTFSY